MSLKTKAAVVVGAVILIGGHENHAFASGSAHGAGRAISFARAQIGRPYVWGGTGPLGFDCSGLAMEAERAAGITIPRTSQQQWAALPHAARPRRGYLVFFAGKDGTPSAPGHVAIVIGPHKMIEAYATGYPIRVATFGTPSSPAGDENPVGYADPGAA